ncbi:MAG: amidohydrolase family protein [Patescibacteria group bacterium]
MNKHTQKKVTTHPLGEPLVELHSHLGGAVDAAILWTLAHEQGIKLPTKDYWEFERMVTIKEKGEMHSVRELSRDYYAWTELIQSSPLAIEPAVHETIGGAYRANNIVVHELRFNPMKRNRGGERDLDYIILAAIRGMENALFEYPSVRAGLILMLDREYPKKLNTVIFEKAKKYQHRGIVGIDLAGPQNHVFHVEEYEHLFQEAKEIGFGVTIHTGEEGSVREMHYIVEHIVPHRIGHGFLAWQDVKLMRMIVEHGITLELCPTSNLNVGVIGSVDEMRRIYRTLFEHHVRLTINTDGPEMHGTKLKQEYDFLKAHKIFTSSELAQCTQNGFEASFIRS